MGPEHQPALGRSRHGDSPVSRPARTGLDLVAVINQNEHNRPTTCSRNRLSWQLRSDAASNLGCHHQQSVWKQAGRCQWREVSSDRRVALPASLQRLLEGLSQRLDVDQVTLVAVQVPFGQVLLEERIALGCLAHDQVAHCLQALVGAQPGRASAALLGSRPLPGAGAARGPRASRGRWTAGSWRHAATPSWCCPLGVEPRSRPPRHDTTAAQPSATQQCPHQPRPLSNRPVRVNSRRPLHSPTASPATPRPPPFGPGARSR
jgi:hypothetical protein